MGHQDLVKLHKINYCIMQLNKSKKWYFDFRVDSGSFETRIDINDEGIFWRGKGNLPLVGYRIFCPDLIDFQRKLIIEFEEEAKPNTGYQKAKKHKGHTEYTNTRDSFRDEAYQKARFILLKIWQSDMKSGLWMRKLNSFLTLQNKYPMC